VLAAVEAYVYTIQCNARTSYAHIHWCLHYNYL